MLQEKNNIKQQKKTIILLATAQEKENDINNEEIHSYSISDANWRANMIWKTNDFD